MKILNPDSSSLSLAASFLLKGEIVAFPTETVYGLGAPIFSPSTIAKIFEAKKRPQDNPLIAHLSHIDQVEEIAIDIPKTFYLLAEHFFPGPLTLVLKKHHRVPSIVSGGGDTIALRIPSHKVARELIEKVGQPIVAPSANLSGKPSSTHVQHVVDDFEGIIAAVIDGGVCEIGLESTVLSLCHTEPTLLRPGKITKEEIENVLNTKVLSSQHTTSIPQSPGMKYRHYAPNAAVLLFFDLEELDHYRLNHPHKRLKVITPSSKMLYESLRLVDKEEYEEVLIFCGKEVQAQEALMNRLKKAAQG